MASALSRLLMLSLWLAAVGLLALGVPALAAAANDPATEAPYVNDCPPADAACLALAERLEAVVYVLYDDQASWRDGMLNGVNQLTADTGVIALNTTPGTNGDFPQAVALVPADRERLDLVWWGAWALVGLMFVLILAPRWFAAFRVTHGA